MTIIHRILTSSLLVLALCVQVLPLCTDRRATEQGQIPASTQITRRHYSGLPGAGVAVCLPAVPRRQSDSRYQSQRQRRRQPAGDSRSRRARIVVFRVAGTIKIDSDLNINHPDITVAGQTAPVTVFALPVPSTSTPIMSSYATSGCVAVYLWADKATITSEVIPIITSSSTIVPPAGVWTKTFRFIAT